MVTDCTHHHHRRDDCSGVGSPDGRRDRRAIAGIIREAGNWSTWCDSHPRKGKAMFLKNGRQLKAARVLAGQTQRELATAAGLHENSVKYWERYPERIGGHAVDLMGCFVHLPL